MTEQNKTPQYAIVNGPALEALLNLTAGAMTYAQCHKVIHAVQQSSKPFDEAMRKQIGAEAINDFILPTGGNTHPVYDRAKWQEEVIGLVEKWKQGTLPATLPVWSEKPTK